MVDIEQKRFGIGQVRPNGPQPWLIAAIERDGEIERATGFRNDSGVTRQDVKTIADRIAAGRNDGLAQQAQRMGQA